MAGAVDVDPQLIAAKQEPRRRRHTLTFGRGAHACVGSPLARLEGRAALEEVLKQWPKWEVDMNVFTQPAPCTGASSQRTARDADLVAWCDNRNPEDTGRENVGRRFGDTRHTIATMTKSSYRIDPVGDLVHAREFMAKPVGLHTPGLQRVLNVLRGEPLTGKYVLVEITPHRRWQLAQLSGIRGQPARALDVFFTDLADAERDVFALRWREHVGHDLALDDGPC